MTSEDDSSFVGKEEKKKKTSAKFELRPRQQQQLNITLGETEKEKRGQRDSMQHGSSIQLASYLPSKVAFLFDSNCIQFNASKHEVCTCVCVCVCVRVRERCHLPRCLGYF